MDVYLLCECGMQMRANEGMAGAMASCPCGRTVVVPGLADLRRLAAEDQSASETRPPRDLEKTIKQHPAAHALGIVWILFISLPLLFLTASRGRPVAALGVLLYLIALIWLFTIIFQGSPAAALLCLVPFIGPVLIIKFLIEHWSLARWPWLCYVAGLLLYSLGGGHQFFVH